jgi:ribosome-binding factor A
LKREVSDILRSRYQGRAALITITEVDVAPDNSHAKVFYSVVETEPDSYRDAQRFLDGERGLIKRELAKRIILKRLPDIRFLRDEAVVRGARIEALIDSLEISDADPEGDEREEDEEDERA